MNKRSLENFVVHFEKAELSPIADMQVHILNYRVIALILVNIVLAVFFYKMLEKAMFCCSFKRKGPYLHL